VTVAIRRWGNSLAMRIPKEIANALKIDENTAVELHMEDGCMIIKPAKQALLDQLISKIESNNLHNEIFAGKAVGHEAW